MPKTLAKAVWASPFFTMNFTGKIPDGVTVSSSLVVSEKWDGSATDLTIASISYSADNLQVQAKFSGGTLDTKYLIRFQATLSDTSTHEEQGTLIVTDEVRSNI